MLLVFVVYKKYFPWEEGMGRDVGSIGRINGDEKKQNKEIFAFLKSQKIFPIFSSRSFVVLCFILCLYDSFSVSSCVWCKGRIKVCVICLLIWFCTCNDSSTICWKDFLIFVPLSNINWLSMCESVSGLSILLHWSMCLSFHQYQVFLITVFFRISFEIKFYKFSTFSFKIVLAIPVKF